MLSKQREVEEEAEEEAEVVVDGDLNPEPLLGLKFPKAVHHNPTKEVIKIIKKIIN